MREEDFAQRIHRLKDDVKSYKNNQIAGGDSWIVYRTSGTFSATTGVKYKLTFTPQYATSKYVAQLWRYDVGMASVGAFLPDPNQKGVWYLKDYSAGTLTINYMLYSSMKGTIAITTV